MLRCLTYPEQVKNSPVSRASKWSWVTVVVTCTVVASMPAVVSAWTTTSPQINFATFGGASSDQAYSVAVSASGNVYTGGSFSGTADFDPDAGVTNLVSAGSSDAFVTKLDPSGNLVWVKQLGGTVADVVRGVAVDAGGNVYASGSFSGTADFDPGAGVTNLVSSGSNDAFVVKLDPSGALVWARQFGAASGDVSYSVTVDAGGNVYTVGSFQGTTDFDPGAGTSNLVSAGLNDVFVVKLDSAGDLVWAKSAGSASADVGYNVHVDGSGNVYSSGFFQSTADFDPGAGTSSLTSTGLYDTFAWKLSSSGSLVWAKGWGGTGNEYAAGAALDSSGNYYTTGYFESVSDFDPGAGTASITPFGGTDAFISKIDANGNLVWARQFGGTSFDFSAGVAVDQAGNVCSTGYFMGTADFDPGAGTNNLSATGSTADIFVAKLNSAGEHVWAQSLNGASGESGNATAFDSGGDCYVAGYYMGTVDFDPGAGVVNSTAAGGQDGFLVRFGNSGGTLVTTTTAAVATTSSTVVQSIASANTPTTTVAAPTTTVPLAGSAASTNSAPVVTEDPGLPKSGPVMIWVQVIGAWLLLLSGTSLVRRARLMQR